MRLAEALSIIGQPEEKQRRSIHLLCGFMPLHLETFVKAHLRLRFSDGAQVRTGLYGDLEGNIQRACESGGDGAIVVVEWSDLDPRLGLRSSAGWSSQTLDDVVTQSGEKCLRIESLLGKLAARMPVTLVAPGLGLPPLTHMPPVQAGAWELQLNYILADFLRRTAGRAGIGVASSAFIAARSPVAARHDIRMDLLAGFPYSLTHADAIAETSVNCLFPPQPRKGIITDLDQTLWRGILGDAGVDGVSWSLQNKSQIHALYQQLLASLADSGVLVAIASKNDPQLVEAVLRRPDLLVSPARIFPVEAGWGAKSDAVARILEAWNIGADSVVFVDDSPMELAEVGEKHPGMECLLFPPDDPAGFYTLLLQLRARFGRNEVRAEDRLRLESLRASAVLRRESATQDSADFISRLDAVMTLSAADDDRRALELVNKTNQFNLNGTRFSETEWKSRAAIPGAFLATVSYEDRFGPLGKIAVLGGYRDTERCYVDVWVMSCRAFSRQIEFQSLRQLFRKTGASEIRFCFKPTGRNGPLQSFFAHFVDPPSPGGGELSLRAEDFERRCPPLFYRVNDQWTIPEKS
jgi:FkbH-like protein